MKHDIKKNEPPARFEYTLAPGKVETLLQLEAIGGDLGWTELVSWWAVVATETGFIADTVADVRWKDGDGRVLKGPPLVGTKAQVSFTAIAYPRGMPDDLEPEFRDWYADRHANTVWGTGQGGSYFHPAELANAFEAGRETNSPGEAVTSAAFAGDVLGWLAALSRTASPLCGIATKSEAMIRELQAELTAALMRPPGDRERHPLTAKNFTMVTKDPAFDPRATLWVNGHRFNSTFIEEIKP